MEQYVITRETLIGAKSYLPIQKKEEFLEHATECFDRLSITSGDEEMPPMWKENASLKARYLLAALLHHYLAEKIVFEDAEHFLISEETFDKYASSHPIMQIERFKRDKDENVRNKAYDLLSDYFELTRMFSTEIAEMLAVQNDPVLRQKMISDELVKQLPQTLEQIKELTNSKNAEAVLNGA